MNLFFTPDYAKTGDVIPYYNEAAGRFDHFYLKNWNPDAPRLTVGQWHISPALLNNHDPETKEYYQRIMDGLRLAVAHRDDPEKQQALEELKVLEF